MKVKCIKGFGCQGVIDKDLLKTGKIYEVALIIEKGKRGPDGDWESGYVLINPTCPYPYIWDKNRFQILE